MSTQFTNRQWRLPNNENKDKQSNYSMDFDGSNYIDIGSDISVSGNCTVSFWFKSPAIPNTSSEGIFARFTGSSDTDFLIIGLYLQGVLASNDSNLASSKTTKANITLLTDTWYHCVVTKVSGVVNKIYIDGTDKTGPATNTGESWSSQASNSGFIGQRGYGGKFNGQIDGVAIFNYALSSSQVTTLYGSSSTGIGNPMSLSPKPVAYYPLGDQDAFNGADYLVPNIAAQEDDGDIATSYSPYALDFDSASSDYIETPYVLPANTTTFSVSMWVKTTSFSTFQGLIGSQDSSSDGYFVSISSYNINFKINGTTTTASISSLNTNTWFHLVVTYDGSNAKVYLNNGSPVSNSVTETINITANTIIGRLPWTAFYYLTGSMSNISIWNTALTSAQVSELYNEGVPSNLNNHSAYSNLVSWWQLGSNTSWVDPYWIALDEKGTNNGQSQNVAAPNNMGESAIVDGVGSYANGVGTSGLEVIGSAPFSDANSLSINMDVLDRSTDVPN